LLLLWGKVGIIISNHNGEGKLKDVTGVRSKTFTLTLTLNGVKGKGKGKGLVATRIIFPLLGGGL